MNFLMVFLGGGLGSMLRYSISLGVLNSIDRKWAPFIATLTSNLLACIALAVVVKAYNEDGISKMSYLLLAAGFCGGFSTFSTFSFETWYYWSKGDWQFALANVVISVVLGFAIMAVLFRAWPNALE